MAIEPSQTKTIIFDFDGTIADSFDLIVSIFHGLVPGHEKAADDEIDAMRNHSVRQIASNLGIPLWKLPFLVRKGRIRMHERLNEVSVFAGIPELLGDLHSRGYALHVLSTNSTENLQSFLGVHNLDQYFMSINGGTSLFGKKKAIKRLCKKYRLRSSEVWYVGDEVRDISAAHKANVRVVAVDWGFNSPEALQAARPDAYAATVQELATIVISTK